jgi:hypothetical protein
MLRREQGLVWQAHPRTKRCAGYPDAVRDKDYFLTDRLIGASYESLPVDLSETRLCESRCFGTLDDMNNWASNPKYMIAEGDTYQKYPGDETYPQLTVNYVRPDRVPRFNEDVSSITRAMQSGQFFVTTGEILFRNRSVEGSGPDRAYTAEVEWTFPLEFVELVWSDGSTIRGQVIPATGTAPFGKRQFRIRFSPVGQEVGALRSLGFGWQRRFHSAGSLELRMTVVGRTGAGLSLLPLSRPCVTAWGTLGFMR